MSTFDKERREALDAGRRALQSLYAARESLGSARGWGVWDVLGGGLLSTLIKRGHMDDARDAMARAEEDLRVFRRELADVQQTLPLETDDFLGFADYFFDGFLVDLLVQSRIAEAQDRVESAIASVEAVLEELEGEA